MKPKARFRRGDTATAWSLANVAVVISKRPFLADVEAPWIESQRSALRAMQMRALQCLVNVSANNSEPLLAVQHALEMIELEPFRETAYQLLMKMHAAAGDRAEALRVFAKMPRAAARRARGEPVAADRGGLPGNPSSGVIRRRAEPAAAKFPPMDGRLFARVIPRCGFHWQIDGHAVCPVEQHVQAIAPVSGFARSGFEAVRDAFVDNFARRHELGGACCAFTSTASRSSISGAASATSRPASRGSTTRWWSCTRRPRGSPR